MKQIGAKLLGEAKFNTATTETYNIQYTDSASHCIIAH